MDFFSLGERKGYKGEQGAEILLRCEKAMADTDRVPSHSSLPILLCRQNPPRVIGAEVNRRLLSQPPVAARMEGGGFEGFFLQRLPPLNKKGRMRRTAPSPTSGMPCEGTRCLCGGRLLIHKVRVAE